MQCFHFMFFHNCNIVITFVYCDVMFMYILQSVICITVIIVRINKICLFNVQVIIVINIMLSLFVMLLVQ